MMATTSDLAATAATPPARNGGMNAPTGSLSPEVLAVIRAETASAVAAAVYSVLGAILAPPGDQVVDAPLAFGAEHPGKARARRADTA